MKSEEEWLSLAWPYDDTAVFRSNIRAIQADARAELLERIKELEQSILHREGMNNDPDDLCEVHITFRDKPEGICTSYEHFKKIWRDG